MCKQVIALYFIIAIKHICGCDCKNGAYGGKITFSVFNTL